MWANTCWGLLGLAVAFGLALFGQTPEHDWLRPYFATVAAVSGVASVGCFCWPLRHHDNRVRVREASKHPFKWITASVEPSHIIILGLVIAFGAVIWQLRKTPSHDPHVAELQSQLATVQQQLAETARAWSPLPNDTDTIQWNKIFGTSRAVDLVFALFLDGKGPASKSVKLKDAYLESGITGEVIKMKVGSTNPLDDVFSISEANPIPPNGFIRLVAVMNPSAPNQGLPNKDFLEHWRKVWFNAIFENEKPDRVFFDENVMGSYFPEIAGPHVTRKTP